MRAAFIVPCILVPPYIPSPDPYFSQFLVPSFKFLALVNQKQEARNSVLFYLSSFIIHPCSHLIPTAPGESRSWHLFRPCSGHALWLSAGQSFCDRFFISKT